MTIKIILKNGATIMEYARAKSMKIIFQGG